MRIPRPAPGATRGIMNKRICHGRPDLDNLAVGVKDDRNRIESKTNEMTRDQSREGGEDRVHHTSRSGAEETPRPALYVGMRCNDDGR